MAADITAVASREELASELRRERGIHDRKGVLWSIARIVVAISAVAAIVAMFLFPTFRIDGDSMTETLYDGDVVISLKDGRYETGDVVAFYHNNDILVKRVIASAGQWVDVADDGTVFVYGKAVDEPYVTRPARGECDIEFPYQVPDGRVFVMGDHRVTSVDSRSSQVGPVKSDLVIGKVMLRVWPLPRVGTI